MQRGKNEQ